MFQEKLPYHIILGSNSPRRKELLAGLDIPFEVITLPDIDESYPANLPKEEIPVYISTKKAEAYRHLIDEETMVITADTIVWLDNKVYGKPIDRADAIRMLKDLSGNTHEVITGVCLTTLQRQVSFAAISKVTFSSLTSGEIEWYIDKYQPYDKAGSYGVQEWIGYIAVEHLEGSFYNVMGLPIALLYKYLKEF